MKKIVMLLVIILLCGCSYDEYEMPKDAYININNKSIQVYEENIKLYDLIGDNNVEILSKNKVLDNKKLGENKITLRYKYKKRKYKYDIKYSVVDEKEPIFLSAKKERTILINSEDNFCDDINIADNYDREVNCIIDGEYDLTKVGKYNLKYIITDNSDNKSEKEFTLNVVEKFDSSSQNNNSKKNNLEFKKVINDYKNEDTMIGIDVSRWQENIDFEKVKKAGCEFVIIRFGINSDIDKDISVDTYYKENIKNAKAAGLKVGIYVYTSAINEKVANEHAKWVIDNLGGEKLDFPIAFDWENWDKFRSYKISMYDLTNSYLVFDKELKKHGYKTMLYSSAYYLKNIWMFNENYDVWLAHYTDKTDYDGRYIMWQMSNIGKIDGVNGDVDIDIYYKKNE